MSAVAAAVLVAAAGCGNDDEKHSARDCGTKELYGRKLALHVRGRRIPCSQVRRIVRGPCKDGKVWSCFSFRPPSPILVWFRERERFKRHPSTAIEARRYPCSEARVTRRAWSVAVHAMAKDPFPSRLQVLGDDIVRCSLLKGKTYGQVAVMLSGRPGKRHHRRYVEFTAGEQRNSFMQTDPEYLHIEFDRHGVFRRASY